MFSRRNNLNRLLALLGALLALSSALQQTHLLCYVAGCITFAPPSEQHACDHCGCAHAHRCRHQPPSTPASRVRNLHHDNHDACPCPLGCCHHQTSQPLEMPRGTTELVELMHSQLMLAGDFGSPATLASPPTTYKQPVAPFALAETPTVRCARLCRYLI